MNKTEKNQADYKCLVGKRMREVAARKGLTAADVVRKIPAWGYSRLSNYLNGINLPDPVSLRIFTKACGCEGCEQWVYYGETASNPPPAKQSKTKGRGEA